MTISGLGPHGERAAPPERVALLPEDCAEAKAASKATFLKLYPAKTKEVETYIKAHDIRFNNEKQINELIAFCNGL